MVNCVGHIELEYLVDPNRDEIAARRIDTAAYSEVEIAYFGVLPSLRKAGHWQNLGACGRGTGFCDRQCRDGGCKGTR